MKTTITLIVVLVFGLLGEAAQIEYKVIDLGTFGGYSYAYAINNLGQIVGWSTNTDNQERSFLWSNGSMQDLGTLGGRSVAYSINDIGQVIGNSVVASGNYTVSRAFLWSNGSMQNIVPSGIASSVRDINNHEQVVGTMFFDFTDSLDFHGFIYSKESFQDLGTLGGGYSAAYGINDIGQVIGVSSDINNQQRAFLWSNGSMQDLGTLRDNNINTPLAINNSGQIVGVSGNMGSELWYAFLYSDGLMQDLGTLGGSYSFAYGINDSGQVVGYSTAGGNPSTQLDRAFLWSTGSMRDLNSLIDPASGWHLRRAYAINNLGQIVGYGDHPSGGSRAFLLNPVFMDAKKVIEIQPEQPTYGNCPAKEVGKDSLVVVTHGWQPAWEPVDIEWVETMTNVISQYLVNEGLTDWQVHAHRWVEKAQAPLLKILGVAEEEGKNLGTHLVSDNWRQIHLIGHSAGSALIQAAVDVIKAKPTSTIVHATFLDAYVGVVYGGKGKYGKGANWADSYFSRDPDTILTDKILSHAYNVDVTWLDSTTRPITVSYSTQEGVMSQTCYEIVSSHGWPYQFYLKTITDSWLAAQGFGFSLSQEGGNWNSMIGQYQVGNNPPQVLGNGELVCPLAESTSTLPVYTGPPLDFLKLPETSVLRNDPEKVDLRGTGLKLVTGSPAWVAVNIPITNRVNFISFEVEFTSANGVEGLLSVYWETNVIGSIDERVTESDTHQYQLPLPEIAESGVRILGFRLDAFSAIQSSVTVTNITLGFRGVREPFSLSVGNMDTNSLPTFQLVGPSGFNYRVESSTNLLDWETIMILVNTNGVVSFVDPSPSTDRRFYRAVTP